ncbi:Cac2p Ecym_2695 [Eremothecium cymbalariae DBVPG|uniref:CAF1B/HIR1 beta-propeller domain-containing protein n=1 Tax=Eremothecium cymbalariae (strain CBS 270.75 / DBVPG 7215 / KCTC 17166 / NRRL Y-17582) TaxID=931890 RepID=G8JPD7_ERECY|nr:Hypothetical protein Ecym_2695 [Eremothecium cymbalariae DBVPG\
MEASSLQIYWHESQPIYSLAFQPCSRDSGSESPRLVTAGGDNKVRIWQLNLGKEEPYKVETIDFLSSLTQHEQAVNVVRFNHLGDILATAGDDGLLLLWKKNDTIVKQFGVDEEEFADFKMSWGIFEKMRVSSASGASEIYDLAWSPCGRYIVTGSMDNTIRIFDIDGKKCVAQILEHNHYVQGVVWDPLDEYIISQSADRSVHICKILRDGQGITGLTLYHKIIKGDLPRRDGVSNSRQVIFSEPKSSYLFHNETLPSFFRRLVISPCGNVLCVPTGIFKNHGNEANNGTEFANSVYMYTRASLKSKDSTPVLALPFLKKPAIVVKFNPVAYALDGTSEPWIKLPYKLVFAVATSSEVLIYDTQSTKPLAIVGNLHYMPLTDLTWFESGKLLMISSTDGFCSYISIEKELLGHAYTGDLLNIKYESPPTIGSSLTSMPNPIKAHNITHACIKETGGTSSGVMPTRKQIKPQSTTSPLVPERSASLCPSPVSASSALTPSKVGKPRRRIQPFLVTEDKNK